VAAVVAAAIGLAVAAAIRPKPRQFVQVPTAQPRPSQTPDARPRPNTVRSRQLGAPRPAVERYVTHVRLEGETSFNFEMRSQLMDHWDAWLSGARVTQAQQERVLAILADAQEQFDIESEAGKRLVNEADGWEEMRMTPDQLARRHAAAVAGDVAAMEAIVNEVHGDAPEGEKADRESGEVMMTGETLDPDIKAALAEVLTEDQLDAFDSAFPFLDRFLRYHFVQQRPARASR